MALRVQRSLRTGWYYRVLEGGMIARGDQFVLRQRPHPDWPLARALDLLFRRTLAFDELECMSLLAELSESWRSIARCRVERREIEDWNERLRIADKNTLDLGHGNS